jgi:Ca2+-binding EF-hand superfamily protein
MAGEVRRLWQRIDRDNSGSINQDELTRYARDAGVSRALAGSVGEGLLGVFDGVDRGGDGNGRVSWSEFVQNASSLVPEGVNERADQIVAESDTNRDGRLQVGELQQRFIPRFRDPDAWIDLSSTKAMAAAKVAVATMDTNGDQAVDAQEMRDLDADLRVERARLLRP